MAEMSAPAIPPAPKLAWRTRPLGGAEIRFLMNAGATTPAAPRVVRNERREGWIRDMPQFEQVRGHANEVGRGGLGRGFRSAIWRSWPILRI